ncbi:hypothetical protein CUR178_07013 [Leishmania enriettii]|uniref:Uncharacterized protein n=1 Tax=Leishmania enriettii TaxID=5663 RepID=A0A836HRL7_LEIEN|nr:hypothetical protein CUR178_07013 [Leishmania enriettii]
MWEGRHAALHGRGAAVTHRAQALTAYAALQGEVNSSADKDDCGCDDDGGRLTTPAGEAFRLSSSRNVERPWLPSMRRRSSAVPVMSRPPSLTAGAAATSVTARSHSPAVWVFEEDTEDKGAEENHIDEAYESLGVHADNFDSELYHAQRVVVQRRPALDDGNSDDAGNVVAPSPRALCNRFRFFSPPVAAGVGGKSSRPARPYRVPFATALSPEEASDPRLQTSSTNSREENSSTLKGSSSQAIKAKVKPGSLSSSRPHSNGRSCDAAHARPCTTDSHNDKGKREAPMSCSVRSGTALSPQSRTASPRSSASSPPSSSASCSSAASGSMPPPLCSIKATRMAEVGDASSPSESTDYQDTSFVVGLGPLMVVHLDVLPELAGAPLTPPRESAAAGEVGSTAAAASPSPLLSHSHLAFLDPCWGALLLQQETDTHEREVAALHARLEIADQQLRVTEQQVMAAAEARAAELVQGYKADERKRRAQFQATLDALREENRELTTKLEAAARAPAIGALTAVTSPLWTSSGCAAAAARETAATATSGSLAVSAAAVSQPEMTRQLQSIEAYWRDRLRTAERHWEDEMSRQTRQRREALDQVEELVRTVEQLQEELRYTRRQAARLREENTRLCGVAKAASAGGAATLALSVSPAATPLPEEVSRLRQALREHQHKEAALLAQVESYGEEATRVRLRCEAALQKAEQELEAERRRSTEMVKLYGSQLESLHQQLREGRPRSLAY